MKHSYKEDGRPADQWYWDDWFAAFDVRLCSLGARGLWVDMLGIMYRAQIRGTFTINGRQPNGKEVAKLVGDTATNVTKYMRELEAHDVFSRLEDNTIICRRMFRKSGKQDQISKIRAVAGKKGAEARWQTDGKGIANMATASSSPSLSSSSTVKKKKENILCEKEFFILWDAFKERGGAFKKQHCLIKFKALWKKGKFDKFKKFTNGYFQFLDDKKINENFDQRIMHLATWLNNWEGEEQYENFKFEDRL